VRGLVQRCQQAKGRVRLTWYQSQMGSEQAQNGDRCTQGNIIKQ